MIIFNSYVSLPRGYMNRFLWEVYVHPLGAKFYRLQDMFEISLPESYTGTAVFASYKSVQRTIHESISGDIEL